MLWLAETILFTAPGPDAFVVDALPKITGSAEVGATPVDQLAGVVHNKSGPPFVHVTCANPGRALANKKHNKGPTNRHVFNGVFIGVISGGFYEANFFE